jgi:hypothetical protein
MGRSDGGKCLLVSDHGDEQSDHGATGLPGGLTVNSATGLISGTPTAPETSTVTLSATNNSGTGKATLMLAIKKGHH